MKPHNHPEGASVNAAGRWDEGHAHYPGRSVVPLLAKSGGRGAEKQLPDVRQKSAEVIVVALTRR